MRQHLLLTPVIPATWKTEMERIMHQSQPGQKMSARFHLNGKTLGVGVTPVIPTAAES
jgi:hypothetical protein